VKITHRNRPHHTDRAVVSGTFADAGTIGWYTSPGFSTRYAFSGSDVVVGAGWDIRALSSRRWGVY
jgi:hypothetical protein